MTETAAVRWSIARRIWFRWAFVYILLYVFPWPLDLLPGLGRVWDRYNQLWIKLTQFVGNRLLQLPVDLSSIPANGTGDSTFSYVQMLCASGVSVILAVIWCWIGRNRQEYRREHDLLYLALRYFLASQMFVYGMVKVIKDQFPDLSLDRLVQPFGDASPMGLLWTFMGFSTAYTAFAGAMEVIGGTLLLFRRTTVLGALVLVVVMGNVVLLNFCYDVPVKIHSTHLLLFAVWLVAPHLPRLLAVILGQAVQAVPEQETITHTRRVVIGMHLLKIIMIAVIVIPPTLFAWRDPRHRAARPPFPDHYGIYEVEHFVRNDEVLPPVFSMGSRWRRVIVNQYGKFAIQFADDHVTRFQMEEDKASQRMTLIPYEGEDPKDVKEKYSLSFVQPSADVWDIEGSIRGDRIKARLHRVQVRPFFLTSRGFHFSNEVYLNR